LTAVTVYGIEPVPVVERFTLLVVIVNVGAADWAIAGKLASSRVRSSVGASERRNIFDQYISVPAMRFLN
jgi:hypothetical protein